MRVDREHRLTYASRFDVPDGGRYSHDWAERIDAVLAALAEAEQQLATVCLGGVPNRMLDAVAKERDEARAALAALEAENERLRPQAKLFQQAFGDWLADPWPSEPDVFGAAPSEGREPSGDTGFPSGSDDLASRPGEGAV